MNPFLALQFKHLPVVRAVSEQTRSVYSLWDQEVGAGLLRSLLELPQKATEGN